MVEFLEKVQISNKLLDKAALVIQHSARYYLSKKKEANRFVIALNRQKLVDSIFTFQEVRKAQEANGTNFQANQLFRQMLENIEGQVSSLSERFLPGLKEEDGNPVENDPRDIKILNSIETSLAELKTSMLARSTPQSPILHSAPPAPAPAPPAQTSASDVLVGKRLDALESRLESVLALLEQDMNQSRGSSIDNLLPGVVGGPPVDNNLNNRPRNRHSSIANILEEADNLFGTDAGSS